MVKISREIPSLQSFCQGLVAGVLGGRPECFDLVLPTKLKVEVAGCFDPLIQVKAAAVNLSCLPSPIMWLFFLLYVGILFTSKSETFCFVVDVSEIPCRFGVAQPFLYE